MKSAKFSEERLNKFRGVWFRLFPNLSPDVINFRVELVARGFDVASLHHELSILSKHPDIDIVIPADFNFDEYVRDNILSENKLFE